MSTDLTNLYKYTPSLHVGPLNTLILCIRECLSEMFTTSDSAYRAYW